ncbi:hypothetical protein BHM03_00036976 [Ensete ventricosum]|nr:hypothetical protein BHM03_00036976 [Ensete ventricosum]
MAPINSNNIPITELFWSLLDKADRKFSRVRDLPIYGRNRNDADLHKAFKIYTQLWKLQQEHRQKLVEAGLRRWEIGEIAARIAQLYYGQYQRTSDSSYLAEAYIFYEAILSREYFRDSSGSPAQQDMALANKQLRFLARFLIVCLVLGRREMVAKLVGLLKSMVDECKKSFQETEFKEWKHVVQEIVRMLQCLEWEPSGSFSTRSGADNSHFGTGTNRVNLLQDIRDHTLPPNPRKLMLYRPSVTHFLMVIHGAEKGETTAILLSPSSRPPPLTSSGEFIFCKAVLALYAPTRHREEFLPDCLPHLPDTVNPESAISQSAVMQLADFLGVANQFVFVQGIVPSVCADRIISSNAQECHLSDANGS